jgi:hypothetical protein
MQISTLVGLAVAAAARPGDDEDPHARAIAEKCGVAR